MTEVAPSEVPREGQRHPRWSLRYLLDRRAARQTSSAALEARIRERRENQLAIFQTLNPAEQVEEIMELADVIKIGLVEKGADYYRPHDDPGLFPFLISPRVKRVDGSTLEVVPAGEKCPTLTALGVGYELLPTADTPRIALTNRRPNGRQQPKSPINLQLNNSLVSVQYETTRPRYFALLGLIAEEVIPPETLLLTEATDSQLLGSRTSVISDK